MPNVQTQTPSRAAVLLRDWLEEEGRFKAWFAAQVEVTPSTLSTWLSGRRIPRGRKMVAIERVTAGVVRVGDWDQP